MLEGLNIAVGLLGVIATLFSTLVGIRQMRYQGRILAPSAPLAPDLQPAHRAPAVDVPAVAGTAVPTVSRPVVLTRPRSVTLAANLLYLLGLLAVAFLVVGLTFSEPEVAAEDGGWPEWLSNSLLLGPFAVVPSLLGIFVARGSRTARILTWIYTSFISLCCGLASALIIEVADADTQAQSIINVAAGVVSTTSVVCAIAVIVLLALPRSHPYFRRAGTRSAPTR
jgi:hypothetical protein